VSFAAVAWALEQGADLGLKPAERLVLIYLADKANGDQFCFPGQPLIAKFTGLAPNTVMNVLRKLEKRQLIRAEASPGRVSKYHILRAHTPANGVGVSDHTPANCEVVTPANDGVVHPPTPANRGVVPPQTVGWSPPPPPQTVGSNLSKEGRKNTFLPEREATAEDAAASLSPRDELWRDGVSCIQGLLGCMDGGARRFLGKLLNIANDDCARVLALLREAERQRPLDAGAWLIANARPFRNAGLAVIASEGIAIEGAAAMQRLLAAEAQGHA
jgi:hypothetical protein